MAMELQISTAKAAEALKQIEANLNALGSAFNRAQGASGNFDAVIGKLRSL